MQLENIFYAGSNGLGMATNALIGFEIGAGNPKEARRLSYFILVLALCINLLISFILFMFSKNLVSIYVEDERIKTEFMSQVWLLMIFLFLDFFVLTSNGFIKGLGMQKDQLKPVLIC